MPFIGNVGVGGMVIILIIALVLFGPSKLPELGRAIGSTLSEFKKGTRQLVEGEKVTKQIDQNDGSN